MNPDASPLFTVDTGEEGYWDGKGVLPVRGHITRITANVGGVTFSDDVNIPVKARHPILLPPGVVKSLWGKRLATSGSRP